MSALETNKFQLSRRSFFRGAIAAIPLAAIPAGAVIAQQAQPARKRSEVLLKTMHDRAVAAWQKWHDLPEDFRERDDDVCNKACSSISRWCVAMREIPSQSVEAAKMKIAVGSLGLDFYHGLDEWVRRVTPGGTRELREQGEIELAALS
jgi:hypothetical protein